MDNGLSLMPVGADIMRICLALALLVIAVDAAARAGPRLELLAGLFWWLRPARYAGLPAERAAARLWLILHMLPECRRQLIRARDQETGHRRVRMLADWLSHPPATLEKKYIGRKINVHIDSPPWRDWLLPLFLLFFFLYTGSREL